jgi:hypothetical protein
VDLVEEHQDNRRKRLRGRLNLDEAAEATAITEANLAGDHGEKRVVAAAADTHARPPARATLPHDDRPSVNKLAITTLDAETLRVRIPSVSA